MNKIIYALSVVLLFFGCAHSPAERSVTPTQTYEVRTVVIEEKNRNRERHNRNTQVKQEPVVQQVVIIKEQVVPEPETRVGNDENRRDRDAGKKQVPVTKPTVVTKSKSDIENRTNRRDNNQRKENISVEAEIETEVVAESEPRSGAGKKRKN
ncbi:MAG: hypothetical protein FWG80_00425 [Alphaproteobacteria bacterium]|nr:hypothetical protein [Alphaproteobacteria bacterium]